MATAGAHEPLVGDLDSTEEVDTKSWWAWRAEILLCVLFSAAGALVLWLHGGTPHDARTDDSVLAECGCPIILGMTVLPPTWVILLTQIWLVLQTGLVGLALLLLKRGFSRARAEIRSCGFPLFVVGCVVDCSPSVWVTKLVFHVANFAAIIVGTYLANLGLATTFHEVYLQFVNSGATSFAVFVTFGSRAAEALALSAARGESHRRTLRRAQARMAEHDKDRDGYLSQREFSSLDSVHAKDERWPKFCAGFGAGGSPPVDPAVGLDVEAVRLFGILNDPLYDWEETDRHRGEGGADESLLSPADCLIVGRKVSPGRGYHATLMIRCLDYNASPSWACFGLKGKKSLRDVGGAWEFDPAFDGSVERSGPHGGKDPWDAWPDMVRLASAADLQAAPTFVTMKLRLQMAKSSARRATRGRVVGATVLVIVCPVAATHLAPGAACYFWILLPLVGVCASVCCAAAGFGEQWADVEHGHWGNVAHAAGAFQGYSAPQALKLVLPLYSAGAGLLRTLPALARLMIMNAALAGIAYGLQLSFDYALLHIYLGHDYAGTPSEQFGSRSLECMMCTRSKTALHTLDVVSWVI